MNKLTIIVTCLLISACMPDYVHGGGRDHLVIRDNLGRPVGTLETSPQGCVVIRDNYSRPTLAAC